MQKKAKITFKIYVHKYNKSLGKYTFPYTLTGV